MQDSILPLVFFRSRGGRSLKKRISQNITIYYSEQCNKQSRRGSCQQDLQKKLGFCANGALSLLVGTIFQLFAQIPFDSSHKSQNGFRGCSEPVQIFLRMQWTCTNKHPWAGSRRDRGLRKTWFRGSFDGWGCVEGIRKYRVFFYYSAPKRSKCHIS